MKISLVLIIYRSNSTISEKTACNCEEFLKVKNIESIKLSSRLINNSIDNIFNKERPDLAIVLGGDGTVLKSANKLSTLNIPILSFNIGGHLGFLTQDNKFLFDKSFLDMLLKDQFKIDNRTMLECNLLKNNLEDTSSNKINYYALNDFYFKTIEDEISASHKLQIEIDKEIVNDYKGDGLIISSATGSTAYSMAAGGPIVHPLINAFVISPICPMSLSSRPIVVPDTSKIVIRNINQENRPLQLWKDGTRCLTIKPNDFCEIKKSSKPTSIISLKNNMSYYSTLIKKLEWKGDLSKPNTKGI